MTQDIFDVGTEVQCFYRRGDINYIIYASSFIPANIAYSTTSKPTGPWKFRNIIMENKE